MFLPRSDLLALSAVSTRNRAGTDNNRRRLRNQQQRWDAVADMGLHQTAARVIAMRQRGSFDESLPEIARRLSVQLTAAGANQQTAQTFIRTVMAASNATLILFNVKLASLRMGPRTDVLVAVRRALITTLADMYNQSRIQTQTAMRRVWRRIRYMENPGDPSALYAAMGAVSLGDMERIFEDVMGVHKDRYKIISCVCHTISLLVADLYGPLNYLSGTQRQNLFQGLILTLNAAAFS